MAAPPRKKLRQAAEESSGKVSTLCFSCRRTEDKTKQQGLSQFFKASSTSASASQPSTSASQNEEALFCSKCRRSMEQKVADRTGGSSAGASRVLPQIARLRQYQRLAAEQRVPFAIPERAAAAIMREPCTACGIAAPLEGHGLTRLRVWPEGLTRPERGGFMGPYAASNLAPACSTCNLMKGCRSVRGCVGGAALRSGGHGPTQRRPRPYAAEAAALCSRRATCIQAAPPCMQWRPATLRSRHRLDTAPTRRSRHRLHTASTLRSRHRLDTAPTLRSRHRFHTAPSGTSRRRDTSPPIGTRRSTSAGTRTTSATTPPSGAAAATSPRARRTRRRTRRRMLIACSLTKP